MLWQVSIRLQLNLLLEKAAGIPYVMDKLPPRLLLPVMWFETDAELPETMAGQLGLLVHLPLIIQSCGLAAILLGLAGMLWLLVCLGISANKNKKCEYAKVLLKEPLDMEKATVHSGENMVITPTWRHNDILSS
jgi:hypothetical protein